LQGNLTLTGPGADLLAVSGSNRFQVFQINQDARVSMMDLAIVNGYTTNAGGAGILNAGNLTLLSRNHAVELRF
jgi:hypothetical protein